MKTRFRRAMSVSAALFCAICLAGCDLASTQSDVQFSTDNIKVLNEADLNKTLDTLLNNMTVHTTEPIMSSTEMVTADLESELPAIDTYKLTVEGTGQIQVEVFASTEKSGSDNDGWLNTVAEKFNRSGAVIDGKSVSVSIRQISTGPGMDYILSGKYIPDAYSPSSILAGEMIQSRGIPLTVVTDRLAGNTAGILMSRKRHEQFEEAHGDVTMEKVVQAVLDDEIVLGYTNPNVSATGANALFATLTALDSSNPLSSSAVEKFSQFQSKIPPVAYTTAQMRDSAASGMIDIMIMEYQAYINNAALKDYVYTPIGVRHDSPLYAVGDLSREKMDALALFAQYCADEESQRLANSHGFNALDEYPGTTYGLDGAGLFSGLGIWKENKDGGRPVIAVFVTDVSGSMDGEPLAELKSSLINASQYITPGNYIGLISYSADVYVNVPIAAWDLKQRGYFVGAIENLQAMDSTATYSAVLQGIRMLLDAKAELPDARAMMFVLSDGDCNSGYKFDRIKEIVKSSGIPIHTIGYNATVEDFANLSRINEASNTAAGEGDVVYHLKNMFSAQM